jgi:uncharacterized membrane protein YgcG
MIRPARRLPWLALVCAWLALPGPARAVFPPPVKDDAKEFKPEALEKANKKIRELYEKYKKDVVVETLASLGEEQQKKLKEEEEKDKKKGRDKFFKALVEARVKELGVNGIYILISKSPARLQVQVDAGSGKAIPESGEKKVRAVMVKQLRDKNWDGALLDGLDAVEAALKANVK